jgi:hypothetical protein
VATTTVASSMLSYSQSSACCILASSVSYSNDVLSAILSRKILEDASSMTICHLPLPLAHQVVFIIKNGVAQIKCPTHFVTQ